MTSAPEPADRSAAAGDQYEITINQGDRKVLVKAGQPLLAGLVENKIFLPSACGGRGLCGYCRCQVVAGSGPLQPAETAKLREKDIQNKMRLACQLKVDGPLDIVIPDRLLAIRDYQATIEKITDLTYDIKGLRLALPEGKTIHFKAGQYMQLHVPPYGALREGVYRAYSISSSPSETKKVELMIRLVPNGIATTYVFNQLREGMTVDISGPYGDFYLQDSEREIIGIAGGSGLAPIRSIVYNLIERGGRRKTTFFFGAVKKCDLYCVEEFQRLAAEHDWFSFVPALSGEPAEHPFAKGLITDVVAGSYTGLENHEAYLCGSPGMIDACIKVLTGKEMPAERIYFDKFS